MYTCITVFASEQAIKYKFNGSPFFTFGTYTNGAAYFKHRLKPFL